MVAIEISEKTLKRVRAFRKVIDVFIQTKLEFETESGYVEVILFVGTIRMLQDVFPKEEMLLKTMMVSMFEQNPEFVSNFIAEKIKEGSLITKEKEQEIANNWRKYIA